jgi:glycosyltransferase involved in cell wall biosynthesis
VQRREAGAIAGLHLFSFDLKLEWMENPWNDVAQSARIVSGLENEFAPDLVHLNSYGHGDVAWRTPVILTAHSCVASWWEAVRGGALPASWNSYRRAVEQSIAAATAVTAPSKAMLGSIIRLYGPMPRQWCVIANGCRAGASSTLARQPLIFSAGRLWDEAKNIAGLARVAGQLTWPVYLAGDSRDPGGAETVFEGCQMLGHLPACSMAKWFACASIYAAPAKYEPFGLAILEAGLAGCALVLGDVPSLREIWQDAAIFVAGDQLEGALRRLAADSRLREEYSARARKRAKEFTVGKTAAAYLNLYESVAKQRSVCAS